MGQLTYVTLVSISLHENIMIGKNYFGTLCNPVTELRHYNHNGNRYSRYKMTNPYILLKLIYIVSEMLLVSGNWVVALEMEYYVDKYR